MAKQVAQDYQISKADILTAGGRVIDVKSSMVELSIFENIERAFLTGTCAIVDTANFVSQMKFTGTERLSVIVENSDNGSGTREITFIMTRIERSEKANDHTDVYVFQLLEEHAFFSRSQKISRAYSGSPISIMNQILSAIKPNFTLDISLMGERPVQQDMRVITPYITPLQAVEWIRDRTTTAQGLPFFVYSSIKGDTPYIKSLSDILKINPWNKAPFTFSQSSTNADERGVFAIRNYENTETDDTLTAIQNGAVSARWEVLDIFKHKFNSEPTRQYNVNKLLPNNAVFDTGFQINDKPITDYQPKVFYHVVASDMFGDKFTSYHDDANLDILVTKINNKGIRNAMYKNMVTISLSGIPFLLNSTATVGTMIDLAFLSKEAGETTDSKRSGKYMITSIRHVFTNAKHTVSAEVTKLTNEQTDTYSNFI